MLNIDKLKQMFGTAWAIDTVVMKSIPFSRMMRNIKSFCYLTKNLFFLWFETNLNCQSPKSSAATFLRCGGKYYMGFCWKFSYLCGSGTIFGNPLKFDEVNAVNLIAFILMEHC